MPDFVEPENWQLSSSHLNAVAYSNWKVWQHIWDTDHYKEVITKVYHCICLSLHDIYMANDVLKMPG